MPLFLDGDFGIAAAGRGLVIAAFQVGVILAAVQIGYLRTCHRGSRLVGAAFSLMALAMAVIALTPRWWVIPIGLALAGIGLGLFVPQAQDRAATLGGPVYRGLTVLTWVTFVRIAQVIGPAGGSWSAESVGPRLTFALSGATMLLAAILWRPARAPGRQTAGGCSLPLIQHASCTMYHQRVMRLANIEVGGERRLGVLDGRDDVIDLSSTGLPTGTIDLIEQWDRAKVEHVLDQGTRLPLGEVRLLAPLVPRKNIIAVGRNYRDHAKEFSDSGFDASEKQMVPDHPVIFTKAPTAVIGPDEPIVLANDPTGTTDYEGEMAVVIGRRARKVTKQEALDHVFGWTIVNDVTARDLQKRHVQWFVGKSPDTFCPMGPSITTIDELPDIGVSWMRTTVNGELRQEAPISALLFDVPTLIATLSEVMTLEPGDVIATGTGLGVGIGFDPPRYLASGDVVEIAIDGIGALRNPVI